MNDGLVILINIYLNNKMLLHYIYSLIKNMQGDIGEQ